MKYWMVKEIKLTLILFWSEMMWKFNEKNWMRFENKYRLFFMIFLFKFNYFINENFRLKIKLKLRKVEN